MTPKEYLSRYLAVKREIDILLDRRQQLWDMMTKVTPTLQTDRVQGSQPAKTDEIIAVYRDVEDELFAKIKSLVIIMRDIERVIDGVSNDRQRDVLRLRYINGLKWEEIAVKLMLDYRWVLRLHGKALQNLTIESHY